MSKLKDAILADGRKQYIIANLIGMDETRLSKIVMGHRKPTRNEQKKLEKVLKTKGLFDA